MDHNDLKPDNLIVRARKQHNISQQRLAREAGTSRPTLSAYEQGRKSPTLSTFMRIIAAAGFGVELAPTVVFTDHPVGHGRVASVPNSLWRLPVNQAFASLTLPLHLNWSTPGQVFKLSERGDRARAYEILLQEGLPQDLLAMVDGALLVDLWAELVFPRQIRAAWQPLIDAATSSVPDLVPGVNR